MVDLRKILATPKLMPTLRRVLGWAGTPIRILDPQGRLLLSLNETSGSLKGLHPYPLLHQKETLGWVVGCEAAAPAVVALLSQFVQQEQAQQLLRQRLLERSQELSLIYRLGEKVASSLEIQAIAKAVLAEIQPLIPSTSGSIMLLNPDSGYLEIVAAYGPEYEPKTPMRLGEGIAGHVLISGQPEIINDVFADMRLMIGNNLMRSLLCVPLKLQERVLGVINISHQEGFNYNETHLKTLITAAAHATPPLHHALLHQIILQENALHSEKRYRIVVEQALEAIMVVDCQTQRILEVNATLARLLGYDREAMHSLSLGDLIDLSPEEIHTRLAQLNPHQFNDWGSQRYRHQDGSLVDVEVGVNLIRQGSRQAYCFIAHDLSQQKQAEAELYRRAYYDPLTSLPNRTYLLAQLRKTLETDRQPAFVGILFLDLDGFKVINDSLGHTNGDELLKVVAQRLCTCLAPDVTVARFSGDEFVILLNGVDNLQTLTGIAEQVMKTLQEPVYLLERPVFPTASIGIALGQRGEDEAENLLQAADIAMHRAKAQGKNRYAIFDKKMYQQAMERMQLESDLRLAVERQELRVYFQPIVLLSHEPYNRTVGFEALVRWEHPVHGLVPPDQFLPVAEESGLITTVDQWVLQQSLYYLQQWQSLLGSYPLPFIAVNLSGRNFSQTDLVKRCQQLLSCTQVSPHLIKLEITESILTETEATVAETLWQLKNMGFRLSIDDFGTGYSSLSRLHLFPIDTLKIDRSFLSRLGPDGENSQTIQMIITLAHSLKMDVVAEGVETIEQKQQLLKFHCEYGQGYHFAPPLTPTAAADRLLAEKNLFKPTASLQSLG